MFSDWCIHVANLFYLASFVGRDMLWLRTLTCAGLVLGLIFFSSCTPQPMYGPAIWHAVFLVINLYQIRHLVKQRERLNLSGSKLAVSATLLDGLSEEELRNTLTRAVCSDSGTPELVTERNGEQLTQDELAFREIAFERLTRQEILNLLTRRMWKSLRRYVPRKRRSQSNG